MVVASKKRRRYLSQYLKGIGNKYSIGKEVCNPFWLVAVLGTKFLKELLFAQQNYCATRNTLNFALKFTSQFAHKLKGFELIRNLVKKLFFFFSPFSSFEREVPPSSLPILEFNPGSNLFQSFHYKNMYSCFYIRSYSFLS